MSLKSVISNASAAGKLLMLGGAAYVGYRIYQAAGDVPNATETATNAYWMSSAGDLTENLLDWYTNGWGYSGPGTSLGEVQDYYNSGGFASL